MVKRRHRKEILTGVEIGTGTIKVVMGEFLPENVLSIIGVGEAPSLKVVKGDLVDPRPVQDQLQKALLAAEHASGVEIDKIVLAVTGSHIGSVNSIGSTVINAADRRISEEDRDTALRNAWSYTLPPNRRPIHFFNRQFRVDGIRDANNPVGLIGSKLEADVHIIYGQNNHLESARSLILEVFGDDPILDCVFSPVAAAAAAFSPEDAEKGALIIDIGAGVTEYAVFQGFGKETSCFHSGQITVGCDHLVNDLSLGLRLPFGKCRQLLEGLWALQGAAVMKPDGRTRLTEIEDLGQKMRHIPVSTVEHIIEQRLQELFTVIRNDLEEQQVLGRIGNGATLCGGGALIPRIDDLAQSVLDMPACIGRPRSVNGQKEIITSPRFMTPIGLLRVGKKLLEAEKEKEPLTPMKIIKEEVRKFILSLKDMVRW